ncbi:acetylornithine transaminase [Nocardioides speluncae]|uniref:acetylornithine transaminase n=1 Tax=Nocardioides speluncae TaxID=2670337 RepID=UPI0023E791A8|nr:acetylornithine transaminase [Nocardioides speluncae]
MTPPTTSTDWQQRYAAALMNSFGPPKLVLTRGSGARVWDADGKEYLDLLGGIAVNSLGHAHPAVLEAVATQLGTLGHISNFFASQPQVELAERLLGLLGTPGRVFLSNSGAEANEAALKLTRLTGRTEIVSTTGAFHGRTMGAVSLTAKEAYRAPFEPLPGGVTFVPYGDAEALATAVTDKTAAVVMEPVQGEAGVVVPPRDYLAAARRITQQHGALLWLDEIQTGVGRTGTWFAHQNPALFDEPFVEADIVTLAKGLAGGIPIGATIATGATALLFEPGNHGTTFGGNPVAAAAALAVLHTIEADDLLDQVRKTGQALSNALAAEPGVSEVRGEGLLIGADLAEEIAPAVAAAALEAGFIVNSTGPHTLRFAPPLILSEDDVAAFAAALPGILAAAKEAS